MKVVERGEPQYDEAKFILVDRHDLTTVAVLLGGVMRNLYDNSPVTAAFSLQEIQDIITEYLQQNQRLFTFDEETE